MRPLTATAGVAVAALVLACGGQTRPTATVETARRPERPAARVAPPATEHESPAAASSAAEPVRDLDRAAILDLKKQYRENPLRTETRQEKTRWRVRGKVVHLGTLGDVELLLVGPKREVNCVLVLMSDRREAEKLTVGREAVVLARFRSASTPGDLDIGDSRYEIDLHLTDGTAP